MRKLINDIPIEIVNNKLPIINEFFFSGIQAGYHIDLGKLYHILYKNKEIPIYSNKDYFNKMSDNYLILPNEKLGYISKTECRMKAVIEELNSYAAIYESVLKQVKFPKIILINHKNIKWIGLLCDITENPLYNLMFGNIAMRKEFKLIDVELKDDEVKEEKVIEENEIKPITTKRTDYISWNDYFMGIAKLSTMRSKDPSTQVGACIVRDNKILSVGYNGFPRGISDDKFSWAAEAPKLCDCKDAYTTHAELNAILNSNFDLKDSVLYVTRFPCYQCAKAIIQCKIKKIYYLIRKEDNEREQIAATMFDEVGIETIQMKDPFKIGKMNLNPDSKYGSLDTDSNEHIILFNHDYKEKEWYSDIKVGNVYYVPNSSCFDGKLFLVLDINTEREFIAGIFTNYINLTYEDFNCFKLYFYPRDIYEDLKKNNGFVLLRNLFDKDYVKEHKESFNRFKDNIRMNNGIEIKLEEDEQ